VYNWLYKPRTSRENLHLSSMFPLKTPQPQLPVAIAAFLSLSSLDLNPQKHLSSSRLTLVALYWSSLRVNFKASRASTWVNRLFQPSLQTNTTRWNSAAVIEWCSSGTRKGCNKEKAYLESPVLADLLKHNFFSDGV